MAKEIKFSDYFCLLCSKLAIHMISSMKHLMYGAVKRSVAWHNYTLVYWDTVTVTVHSYLHTMYESILDTVTE